MFSNSAQGSYRHLGVLAGNEGNYEDAKYFLQKAYHLAKQDNDPKGMNAAKAGLIYLKKLITNKSGNRKDDTSELDLVEDELLQVESPAISRTRKRESFEEELQSDLKLALDVDKKIEKRSTFERLRQSSAPSLSSNRPGSARISRPSSSTTPLASRRERVVLESMSETNSVADDDEFEKEVPEDVKEYNEVEDLQDLASALDSTNIKYNANKMESFSNLKQLTQVSNT